MEIETVHGFLQEAFSKGQFGLGIAVLIMAVVWVVGRQPALQSKITDRNILAWVSLGTGVVGSVLTGIVAGHDWVTAVVNGLTVGAAASGLWSTVGKTTLGAMDAKQTVPETESMIVSASKKKAIKRDTRKRS